MLTTTMIVMAYFFVKVPPLMLARKMHRILAVQKPYNNGLELMIYVYEKWQLLLLLFFFLSNVQLKAICKTYEWRGKKYWKRWLKCLKCFTYLRYVIEQEVTTSTAEKPRIGVLRNAWWTKQDGGVLTRDDDTTPN